MCVLPPEIFTILENTPYGRNNELQLTDAMKQLAVTKEMIGVAFTGTRYDMGNKLSAIKAGIETGLSRQDIGPELKDYIIGLAEELKKQQR